MEWLNKNIMAVLALIVVLLCFLLFFVFSLGKIDAANKEISLLVLGAIIGSLGQVLGYFFGSSAGSAKKTELLTGPPALAAEIKSFVPATPAASAPLSEEQKRLLADAGTAADLKSPAAG